MCQITLIIEKQVVHFNSIQDVINKIDQYAFEKRLDWYDNMIQRIYNMEKHYYDYDDDMLFYKDRNAIIQDILSKNEGINLIQKYIKEFELSSIIKIID